MLDLGHHVLGISRGRSASNEGRLEELAARGAQLAFADNLIDIDRMAALLSGSDVAVVTLRMNASRVLELEPPILEAARRAKVRRFVPDEFGTHTKGLEYGLGTLFDAKKKFAEQIFVSGLEWTLVFTGGIFDYFLPN